MTGSHALDVAISVRGLTKRYGDVEVLRGIDLEIRRGELLAIVEPNGAGKTTMVEILERFRGTPLDAAAGLSAKRGRMPHRSAGFHGHARRDDADGSSPRRP
jgi:ABC-type phosphate/phosphonate transport system ATPase subunit